MRGKKGLTGGKRVEREVEKTHLDGMKTKIKRDMRWPSSLGRKVEYIELFARMHGCEGERDRQRKSVAQDLNALSCSQHELKLSSYFSVMLRHHFLLLSKCYSLEFEAGYQKTSLIRLIKTR